MIRRAVAILLITIAAVYPASAQETGWCGYALIEGLPLLANQLASLESITPDKNSSINPSALFQYRFNLDHSQLIVEACWKTAPTRDLIVSLLAQTIQYDPKVMGDQITQAIQEAVTNGGQVTTLDVVREYVDQNLVYSIFAPKGTHEESAASVRAYIYGNLKAWESPEE